MSKMTWKSPAVLAGIVCIALLLAGCTVTTPQGETIVFPEQSSASASAPSAAAEDNSAAPAATDKQLFINQVVSGVMDAAPSGTQEQLQTLRSDAADSAEKSVDQLVAAGVPLDEETQNILVGAIIERGIANGLFCWASNLGPENEIAGAGVQRRELSTGGLMHVDHYNSPQLPSVSILVRAGEAAVVAGFGSQFEFPFDRCGGYDFVADATEYARARRDWGHSGVVFATLWDALNGAPPVVNLWGLTREQIDQLRPRLWNENPQNTAAVRAITGAQVDPREAACGAAQVTPHPPVHGEPWVVSGPAVVSFWSNWPDMQTAQGQEFKLFVPEGQSVALRGGGTSWTWSAGCGDIASAQFAENGLPLLDARYIVQ